MSEESGNISKFEEDINKAKKDEIFELKLFITGMTPNSIRAVRNIREICKTYLKDGKHSLEVIDIYQQAERAKEEDIIATPTLVKKSPGAPCRLVGDLSNTEKVLSYLGLKSKS